MLLLATPPTSAHQTAATGLEYDAHWPCDVHFCVKYRESKPDFYYKLKLID